MKAFLCGANSYFDESKSYLERSVEKIKKSIKLSNDEKKYLLNYASKLAGYLDVYGDPFVFDNDYNVNLIPDHYRKNFPYVPEDSHG